MWAKFIIIILQIWNCNAMYFKTLPKWYSLMIGSIINHMAVFIHILHIRTISSIDTVPILMFIKVFAQQPFLYQYQFRKHRYCLKIQESASTSIDSIPHSFAHSFCSSLYISVYHVWLIWTDLSDTLWGLQMPNDRKCIYFINCIY